MSDEEREEKAPAAGDILPAEPGRSGWTRLRPNLSPRVLRWGAVAVVTVLLLGTAGVAYATYDYHQEYRGRILPGAIVAGVDIGGLTPDEAELVVDAALARDLDRNITLKWQGRTWDVTPRELGARARTTDIVAAAASASANTSVFDKARMRMFGSDRWFALDEVVTHPRKPVVAFVRGLAESFDRKPRRESIDYSSGWVKLKPAQDGRKVRVMRTVRSLRTEGLETGAARVSVAVDEAKRVPKDKYDQILLLRIGENKLYLYEDGKITRRWTVATGQPEYPTPTGLYEITLKRYMPTWVNPDPTGWGASMPLSIPPGPGNPLGLRALNWSAPAIRFHGTSATYSLGYNASHGCVRMANEDVIELYDTVDIGTPIVSTIVAPLKPMYAAAPDPTVVSDDGSETAGEGEEDSETRTRESDGDGGGPPGQRKKN
jgi:lipoprotein-anchoring transpeptidase ErfK/SrfK